MHKARALLCEVREFGYTATVDTRMGKEDGMAVAASVGLPVGASIAIPGIVVLVLIVLVILWLVF